MITLSRRRLLTEASRGLLSLGTVALLAACGASSSTTTAPSSRAASQSSASNINVAKTTIQAATAKASSASSTSKGKVTLHFYSSGDVNIQNLWNNDLLPIWNKQHPNTPIQLIFSEHGANNQAVLDKLAGAKTAGKPTDIDLYEGGTELQQYGQQGLFEKLTTTEIPDLAKTPQDVVAQVSSYGVPYRASSVVLAYNSSYVKTPPTSLDEVYTWIKDHKGKFTYNPPDTGGSGSAFVTATLKKFIPHTDLKTFETGYDASFEKYWDPGFSLLKGLGPYILKIAASIPRETFPSSKNSVKKPSTSLPSGLTWG